MLFSLYMNDLPSVVKSSRAKSYVDDTKNYLSFSTKDLDMHDKSLKISVTSRGGAAQIVLSSTPEKLNSLFWGPDS